MVSFLLLFFFVFCCLPVVTDAAVAACLEAIHGSTVSDSPEAVCLNEALSSFLSKATFSECLIFACHNASDQVIEHLLTRYTNALSPDLLARALCTVTQQAGNVPQSLLAQVALAPSSSLLPSLNPLLVACAVGQHEKVQFLLENSVCLPPSDAEVSALAISCAFGHTRVVHYLASKGQDTRWNCPSRMEFQFDERLGLLPCSLGRDLVETCLINGHYELALFWLSRGVPLADEIQSDPNCERHLAACLAHRTTDSESAFDDDYTDGEHTDGGALNPVSAAWDNLSLSFVKTSWLPSSMVIVHLNISDNRISQLPEAVFTALPCLVSINVSFNELKELDIPANGSRYLK